jgi:hypothetical protein
MSSATEAAPASDRRKLPAPGTATLSRRHELRNLKSKVPEDQWPEFKARAIACYHAASPALARMLRDDIAVTHGTALPSGLTCLQDDFEACIAHCARYCTSNSFVQQGSDLTTKVIGFARQSGLAESELAPLGLWPS